VSSTRITQTSLIRREVNRFMKIKRQTIGGPLLETFLYISVFGAALGTRIHHIDGFKYIVFVIPGLIMMAWAMNAFANNSSSILQQKFTHSVDDQLSSPASPLQLLFGFTLGGFIRGFVVAALTFIVAAVLVSLPLHEPLVLVPALILVGMFFAQAGVLVGVRAVQFDDVALYQTFMLQPLIFLGGVFYSASLLPQPWQTLSKFNPVYYMISLVRYGFLGYKDTSVLFSFAMLLLFTGVLTAVNYWIFVTGRYLRT
jgi:ABC-2 type transport system permease protein